jgi:hypothetical protein
MLLALALTLQLSADAPAPTRDFRACGIDAAGIQVEFSEELQDDVARVPSSATMTDDQLRCLAKAAVAQGDIIEFADPTLMTRFADIEGEALRMAGFADARRRLAALGLLDKLPVFDPARDKVTSFTKRLEVLCGAKPGSVLKQTGERSLTLDPAALRKGMRYARSGRQVECVTDAVIASDLDTAGISFGFIGNEAVGDRRSAK